MFASQVTRVVEIDGIGAFTVRRLNRKRLAQASQAAMVQSLDVFKRVGGAEILSQLRSQGGEEKLRAMAERDPFLGYDRTTLVELGVVGWPEMTAPTREEIEDLDPDVEERLAREVFELSRPKTEEERKKD